MQNRPRSQKSDAFLSVKDVAKTWGVTPRTVRNWVGRYGAEVCGTAHLLAEKILTSPKSGADLHAKAAGFVAAHRMAIDVQSPGVVKGDMASFLAEQERFLGWAGTQLRMAQETGQLGLVSTYAKLTREFGSTVLSTRKGMATLGLDSGDLVAWEELDRIIVALVNRLVYAVARLRDERAPGGVGLQDEAAVADWLEPRLLLAAVLQPVAAAANTACGTSLPERLVKAFKTAIGAHIQDGEAQLSVAMQNDIKALHE